MKLGIGVLSLTGYILAYATLAGAGGRFFACPGTQFFATTCAPQDDVVVTPPPAAPPPAPVPVALQTPLFTPDNVAPDAEPEFIDLANDPTLDNAVMAAISNLIRAQRAMEAQRLMIYARENIMNMIAEEHNIPRHDILGLTQKIAEQLGLPVANLEGVPPPEEVLTNTGVFQNVLGKR